MPSGRHRVRAGIASAVPDRFHAIARELEYLHQLATAGDATDGEAVASALLKAVISGVTPQTTW